MDNSMRPNSFKTLKHTLSWLYVWGIAFGYIEAVIVIYLRKIYYPDGFRFPIVLADIDIAAVEMLRELMTLILILAVAELTFRTFLKKFAACMIIFGIWDILFLIPLPWVGPVLAPVLVSLALIYAGIVILVDMNRGYKFQFDKRFWIMEIIAGIIIIISFMISGTVVINQTIPASFPWIIFLVGLFFGLVVFHYCLVKDSNVLSDP